MIEIFYLKEDLVVEHSIPVVHWACKLSHVNCLSLILVEPDETAETNWQKKQLSSARLCFKIITTKYSIQNPNVDCY